MQANALLKSRAAALNSITQRALSVCSRWFTLTLSHEMNAWIVDCVIDLQGLFLVLLLRVRKF